MDQLKRVLAVLGAAFGSHAMFYLVFAGALTLKNFGLSVEDQLTAQLYDSLWKESDAYGADHFKGAEAQHYLSMLDRQHLYMR